MTLAHSFLATLAVAIGSAACAGNPRPLVSASAIVEPDLSGMLRLFGRSGLASGCPISADRALTSAHVVDDRQGGYSAFMWDTPGQGPGITQWREVDRFRDLAVITPHEGTFSHYYDVAREQPQVGSRVYLAGYDFRSRRAAFAPRVWVARVLRVVAGHVIFHPAGVPGTSGSCLLDEDGHAVAVNKGGKEIDGGMDEVGIAVGIWGPLLQLGSQ